MMNVNEVEILLVEDNPQDAELTTRALKKQKMVNNIFTARDGAEALDFIFCRGSYSGKSTTSALKVILLDLKLPKVNGLELLKEIKKNERTRFIPVVVVTSSREDPDIKAAYELGANSYVVKPVDFEAFSQAMSNIGLYWLLINQPKH
jgi:two-component system response regulator